MHVTNEQVARESLADFGKRATQLLWSGDFSTLAHQFGYALAFGQDPASAIRDALASGLKELGASAFGPLPTAEPSVSYFKLNESELFALVTQDLATDGNGCIFLELIVTSKGSDKHVTLEQVSAAAQLFVQADR